MPRKQHEQGDSLEMLLDTMCNAFGGIILIAIMIALMARPPTPEGGDPEAELVKIQIQVKEPQSEDLTAELDELAKQAQAIDPAVTNLVVLKNDLAVKVTAAKTTMNNLASTPEEKKELEAKIKTQQTANSQKSMELAAAQTQYARAQAQLNQANKGKPVTVKAPRVTLTEKKAAFIILKDGKFWAADIWVNGVRQDNDKSCRIYKDARGRPTKQVPIPSRGVQVIKDEARLARTPIGVYLRTLPKNEYFTQCQVHVNSFAEFRIMKEILIKNGIQYNWEPSDKNEIAIFYGTGGGPATVQ